MPTAKGYQLTSGKLRPKRMGSVFAASSSPVTTAWTPSKASADVESMERIFALAYGLWTMATCFVSGRWMSWTNLPVPQTKRLSSTTRRFLEIYRRLVVL